MCCMSKSSMIAQNVWLGPTPDSSLCGPDLNAEAAFDVYIEANDLATPPELSTLKRIHELSQSAPQHLEFHHLGALCHRHVLEMSRILLRKCVNGYMQSLPEMKARIPISTSAMLKGIFR